MCFAPQRCALFRHLNFQKWSEHGVFCTFWLGNVLRATTACTFSTSQLPKVVGACGALYILTSTCFAPQRCALFRELNFQKWSENGVLCAFWLGNVLRATTACTFSTCHLLKVIRPRKFFYTFDFEMCFTPQQRALFGHLNFQKWSEHGVLCTFWLGNVLRATTACNFSSLIWPLGSAPAALASLLFDPPEWQIIGKNRVSRNFPTFSGTWIFFLLRLSLLWSSRFFSSLFWLFPPLLFHLSILSEVWLLNFLRLICINIILSYTFI